MLPLSPNAIAECCNGVHLSHRERLKLLGTEPSLQSCFLRHPLVGDRRIIVVSFFLVRILVENGRSELMISFIVGES